MFLNHSKCSSSSVVLRCKIYQAYFSFQVCINKLGNLLCCLCFLIYFDGAFGFFDYSKMANFEFRTYSKTFWIMFETFQKSTKHSHFHFYVKTLQQIQEKTNTFNTYYFATSLKLMSLSWFLRWAIPMLSFSIVSERLWI